MCKKQRSVSHSSTESEIISLDAGKPMDGLPALDFWDVVIEVLRSTNNTARQGRQTQGNLCRTGEHFMNKTRSEHQLKRKSERLSNCCQMWIMYQPTHILLKVSLSCTFFEDNEAVIKMIIKGRSPTMRHVSRTHKVPLDLSFDRINLESKIQIKYVDTVTNGIIIFVCSTWWVYRCSLAAISVIFFRIRSESRAPCQKEVKKRLQVKAHQWQNQSQWYRRRRDHSTWYHAAMPTNEKEWK